MIEFLVLSAALAAVNAGFLTGQHAVEISSPSATVQASNILRNPGNLAQVSAYSKTIETPYSSQTKSDVRIGSPGIYTHHGPIIYNPRVSQGLPATGSAFPSGSSVAHVTYNTGPVAYATAPTLGRDVASYGPSFTDHTVGSSRENTVHSLDGNNGVAHYSKAVDTSFSSVRKSDSQLASDPKTVSVPPTAYATSTTYGGPVGPKINPTVSYSSAPAVAHASFSGFGTHYNW